MTTKCIIVMPCIDLNDYVVESLRGCLAVDYESFQIVLLPDGPVLLPDDISGNKRVSVIVTGALPIAAKRNIAIRNSPDASYFALIDSDAYPDAEWLKNGISFLEQNRDVWAVGGPNITPPGESFVQQIVGNAKQSFLVSGPLYFAKKRSSDRYCTHLHSCNLILPRIVFDTLGGFDESLFSGEDRNLCDRIRAQDKRIFFKQAVEVYHHNRRFGKPFINQCLAYGHGSIAINRRAGNRFNALLFLPLIWGVIFFSLLLAALVGAATLLLPILFVSVSLSAVAVEAIQCSNAWQEVPLTFAAILTCYAATTIGQCMALMGMELDLKRIYTNFPASGISIDQQTKPSMNWRLIRVIDRWAGIPLLHLLRLLPRMRMRMRDESSLVPQQVLFIKFWGIGNIFMILPSIQAVREQWPDAAVDFLTLENNGDALAATGAVRHVALISTRSITRFLETWRYAVTVLRKNRYDVIIDCEQFSRFSAIITRQISAPVTIGFSTRGQYRHHLFTRPVMYNNDIHITWSFYSLVRAAGIESPEPPMLKLATLPALRERGRKFMERFDLGSGQLAVLMHIGTSTNFQERRWLPERYAALADRLVECWNAKIFFTGLPEESGLIEETLRYLHHAEKTIDLGGRLAFKDYFGLIAASDLVISADTAAVHLASAVSTPVVGLYGPNTPLLYGPWGLNSLSVYKKFECSPCITNFNAKIHACRHADGRGACMAAITSDAVFEALQEQFPDLAASACPSGEESRKS